ncbi:MAG TPA: metallophosphoesterase family protein [Acidimicrobiia bacterium]|nr:metallophosphoesterase family protein [Acidimicrobiia bacterium]
MAEARNVELMSVGPDEAVITFTTDPGVEATTVVDGVEVTTTGPHHVARLHGLEPATEYAWRIEGVHAGEVDERYAPDRFSTLARPSGALLATVATANDVHFGEIECGRLEMMGHDLTGEVFTSQPGEAPYPEVMNRGAIAEMAALDPDAVVVKGDLTSFGTEEEYESFLRSYGVFGDRLHHVRGNHDVAVSDTIAATGPFAVELPGVILAVLDTARFRRENGRITPEQLGWLDELAAEADRPVLVFGHHHPWSPDSNTRSETYFGIVPDDSDALVDVIARRESIAGYFAGHTHRNRVRRFAAARDVPIVEVACVKDYPGAWAEYRIHEGGFTQVMRRIATPEALDWTEKTRQMFHGLYRDYALGPLDWRCFAETF